MTTETTTLTVQARAEIGQHIKGKHDFTKIIEKKEKK